MNASEYKVRSENVNYNEATNIQFTSGTTGKPKGATLSHLNLLNNAKLMGDSTHLTQEDRICLPVPMYHCFGMVLGELSAMLNGAAVVFPSFGFQAAPTLKALSEEKCTSMYGVPTMFNDVVREQIKHKMDLVHAKKGLAAGSVVPPDLMEACIQHLNLKGLQIAYGMTELSPACHITPSDLDLDKRTTTVGMIMPHTEAKIVETNYDENEGDLVVEENPKVCLVNESGELWVRGYAVMMGYWNDEVKTEKAINKEGWMQTGDLATMDEQGCFKITGRLKDTIIRGGENIYPTEIEEILRTHPDIHDAQIIGQPDKRLGETVRCVLIMKPGKTELTLEQVRDFCEEKMAKYKIPAHLDITDEYPATATKKVVKNELKKQFNFAI